MALFTINNAQIVGMSASVPAQVASNWEAACLPEKERALFIKTTGIEFRRVAPAETTAADLCAAAAEKLLKALDWAPATVDLLVFVSQTPDFLIPGSSMHLQNRLGLAKTAMTLDINQGCAGYPYGLSVASSLIAAGGIKRALFLVGDTLTRHLSDKDKSTWPIFSDAGSATAIEWQEGAEMHFNLQTDGSGLNVIQTPEGGARTPFRAESLAETTFGNGVIRRGIDMGMQGLEVFNFAVREVPGNVQTLMDFAGENIDSIDAFVFHQANRLMNETLRRKMKLPAEKVPYSIQEYGNTSCATLPVTVLHAQIHPEKALLAGFGVGLSWGSALVNLEKVKMLPIFEI